jgi:hypothetical protein
MEHGPMITSSRSSLPSMIWRTAARVGDQRFHRRAGDGEEPDQVLGWRQRRDVADALVVGLTGLFGQRQAVGGVGGRGRGLGAHDGLSI